VVYEFYPTVSKAILLLVLLGSETHIYEFPSTKCRSIEVGNVVFPSGKLGILRAPPTSDSEIRVSEPIGTQHMLRLEKYSLFSVYYQ